MEESRMDIVGASHGKYHFIHFSNLGMIFDKKKMQQLVSCHHQVFLFLFIEDQL
jgi:hypothetical protein